MSGMQRMRRMHKGRPHTALLEGHDDDPLSGVANLFDAAMVFAVALLVALVARLDLEPTQASAGEAAGKPGLETLRKEGALLERYEETNASGGGDGVRLGMAYRLASGEIVYVPEDTDS